MWCKGGLTGDFLSEKSFLLQIAFLSLIGVGAGGPGGPWPPHQIWKSVNPFSTAFKGHWPLPQLTDLEDQLTIS
jgi:hypothetical protein